jgi:hypothetical protein
LRRLAKELRDTIRPRALVIVGASCGGIMALRCVAGDESGALFDGLLAIDPDMQEEDCFVTRLFGDLDPESEDDAIEAVKRAASSCRTLFEWVSMHEHMLQCIDKMQDDVTPLIRQGRAFAAPFRNVHAAGDSPFVPWLREACERARVVRCVLPDNPGKHRIVSEIRLMHLDHHSLGPRFADDTMVFASASTHWEMLRTEHMIACIDEIVELL